MDHYGKISRATALFIVYTLMTGVRARAQSLDPARDSTRSSPDSVTRLNEVIVTAQKREETLGKIPIAVSAITANQVREYRLWNNKDLSGIVPNLYAADPGDGRDIISIRGITTTSYDPAVATYIDGVNQFGLDTYIPSLFDVERIEVLRGPQGTLYGRNAMGGVINIITRQPAEPINGFVEVNEGNYGEQRYSAGFRMPLIKNKLFIGAAGLYDGRNGYYTNLFTNQSYDKQHSVTGNYYLKYLVNARWLLDLNIKHHNNRNHGAFPLVADAAAVFKQPFVLDQNAVTTMIDNTFNSSLSASYKGSAFNFVAQTAYQKNYRYYTDPIDGDFSPLDAISIINNYGRRWNNVKAVTEDLRFTSPGSSPSSWKWTAGSYWFFQDQPNRQATRYGKDANLLGVGDSLFSTINTTQSHKWGMAFYGQASYALTKKANLTAGLRYDYERQSEDVLGEYQHDPDPDPIVIRPDTSGRVSFYALSPKLSFDYGLSDNSLLYAVYSRGFRTGGLTQLSSDPSAPPLVGFRPELSNSYEAGIKTSWLRNTFSVNADLFYTAIDNAQVPTLVLPDAITITKNAGKLNNWGAEAELAAAPFKGWSVTCNFGYTHSRFANLRLSQNGAAVDLAGKHQVFTPDITALLAIQYVRRIAKGWQALARGEWKHTGTTWFDLANTIRQSPYDLYNVRCGVGNGQLELMFWSRNTGNKKYISYAYDFGAFHLGDPATYGVTLSVRFRG
jgi:iron complex outermembrane receptor protein